MKILLLGKDGQVGWELQRALAALGPLTACSRADADLSSGTSVQRVLEQVAPDVVVNAAAYTGVDQAERETDLAMRINATAPGEIARWAARSGALLVQYSTDYVFDGLKLGRYDESDATGPQNAYGRSKLAGERAIAASGCRHLIFRTSWLFAPRGANFLRTMLRLAGERDEIRVVDDQFGAPTSAELVADVTALALYRTSVAPAAGLSGIYHLTADGETSWFGFAKLVIEEARRVGVALRTTPDQIRPIGSKDYATPATRPANSRLDTGKICKALGIVMPRWQEHALRCVRELANGKKT